MYAEDRREKERIDAKNALEEHVYLMREKIEGNYSRFVEPNEKSQMMINLSALENWLYEEGSEENRAVYCSKLAELMV
jgi:molecular chaperone DnaK (HSP70)